MNPHQRKQMCKIFAECTLMVPCSISFDTFETLHFFQSRMVQKRRKAHKVWQTVKTLLDFSQRCDLSVAKVYIFFQTIELPLYQNSIVDAMRMYLGHICTIALLPLCHPHCLIYLTFMYCRTKSILPVIFVPAKETSRTVLSFIHKGFLFCFVLFSWHCSDTEYPFPCYACVVFPFRDLSHVSAVFM